jgi:membrane associated rhomboid family serine protease
MFIPIGTDRRLKHRPYVNTALIVVNVVVSIFVWSRFGSPQLDTPVGPYMLLPWRPEVHQFFTYQFLHADWEHLLFNMLFLYVFGNALEDRLGPVGYLAFYLAGGVFAAVGYALTQDSPILGASGSIAAVTGAFLALFPATRVHMIIWFFLITTFEVPAILLILFSVGQDLFFQLLSVSGRPVGNVAYLAHLSGNLFGFVVGMGLLLTRILPREPYDFVALIDRFNRRRQMRSVTRRGDTPWTNSGPAQTIATGKVTKEDQRIMQMRDAINRALVAEDASRALDTYERLLRDFPDQVLSRDAQLDLANHAMGQQRHGTAAKAYERFIAAYPRDDQASEVHLLLGLVYARYLNEPAKARPNLEKAIASLNDESRKTMARELLESL